MQCPVCESFELTEDDATGQLICLECGTATGMYQGITQTQEHIQTRGLRVVGGSQTKKHQTSLNEIVKQQSTREVNSQLPIEFIGHPEAFSTQKTVAELTEVHAQSSYPIDNLSDSEVNEISDVRLVDQTAKPKRAMRPFRLSEPFTHIMLQQTADLARELRLTDSPLRTKLFDTVWCMWLNYLAVTGELGETAWRRASACPTNAANILLDLEQVARDQRRSDEIDRVDQRRQSKSVGSGTKIKNKKKVKSEDSYLVDVFQQDWSAIQRRLDHFCWVGWSSLYEPNEGNEKHDPFLTPLKKAQTTSAHKVKRKRVAKRKGRPTAVEENMESPTAEDGCTSYDPDMPDVQSDADSEEGPDPEELTAVSGLQQEEWNKLLNGETGGDSQEDSDKLEQSKKDNKSELWRRFLLEKLAQCDPWKRIFWRGQFGTGTGPRGLLDHNIALLFFAHLSISRTRPAVNPVAWPHEDDAFLTSGNLAVRQMVTLLDLIELTKCGRLTYCDVVKCLPRGIYALHDRVLKRMFIKKRTPQLKHVTAAAIRLLAFFGFYQLPKFPFTWLVQKHVVALGLPSAFHNVIRLLVIRFKNDLSYMVGGLTGPALLASVPWARLLRIEVVAMAFVLIALRLIFKFDDVSEHRSSRVAKFLNATIPSANCFDWSAWATYVEKRFSATADGHSNQLHTEKPLAMSNVPLIFRATSDQIQHAPDVPTLLGNSEFKPGASVGWGEESMYQRKLASAEGKFALSNPIRDVAFPTDQQQTDQLESSQVDLFSLPDSSQAKLPPPPLYLMDATNDPPCEPNLSKSFTLTPSVHQGFFSPFRLDSLDFLIDPTFSCFASIDSQLLGWFSQLRENCSNYHEICTGIWSPRILSSSSFKHRSRSDLTLHMPRPVKQLISEYNEKLAYMFEPIEDGESSDAERVLTQADHTQNGTQSKPANRQPSASLQWLTEICCMVCGAPNLQHFLREVSAMERIMFVCSDAQQTTIRAAVTDMALFSCLDLNDEP